jgi:hypothetical protein
MDKARIEEIRKIYAHYSEGLNKNTAVAHIKELLQMLDNADSGK